jgi:hypothetical protein
MRKAAYEATYTEHIAAAQHGGIEPPPLPPTPFRFEDAFYWSTSLRNIRIERWWRSLADSSLREYLHYFESLAKQGWYAEVKPDRIAIRYVYMEMLRARISGFVSVHNSHRIRKQPARQHYLPTGKPRQLYEYPSVADLHEPVHEPILAWIEGFVQDFDIDRYLPEKIEQLCARICVQHGYSAESMQKMRLGKNPRTGEDLFPHQKIYLLLRADLRRIHGQVKGFLIEQPTPRAGMKLLQERIKAAVPPEVCHLMHTSYSGAETPAQVPFPLEPIEIEGNMWDDEEVVADIQGDT